MVARKVKFMEAERFKIRFKGLWEGGNEGLLLNGYRISVWGDDKVLEIDSADGCTALWMSLMPLNCTRKNS